VASNTLTWICSCSAAAIEAKIPDAPPPMTAILFFEDDDADSAVPNNLLLVARKQIMATSTSLMVAWIVSCVLKVCRPHFLMDRLMWCLLRYSPTSDLLDVYCR
jgi:hypothetical protein